MEIDQPRLRTTSRERAKVQDGSQNEKEGWSTKTKPNKACNDMRLEY